MSRQRRSFSPEFKLDTAGLIFKQPSPHKYKSATVERPDIPIELDRQFDVEKPD